MSHTPRPWRLEPCSHGGLILRRGDENAPLMSRHPQGSLQIVPEADARLIAAAPEMFDALQYILQNSGDPVMENVARAAIAIAEGKQP